METAKEIFINAIKGINIITPKVIGYYKIKDGAVELSYGTGITHNELYGVTVVKNGKHRHDLCECFNSEKEARTYIESLEEEVDDE